MAVIFVPDAASDRPVSAHLRVWGAGGNGDAGRVKAYLPYLP